MYYWTDFNNSIVDYSEKIIILFIAMVVMAIAFKILLITSKK